MISFRYHLTTLVAVFLALAVGVVLGGGPLSELGRKEPVKAGHQSAALKQVTSERDQAEQALTSAAPALIKNGLKGRTVTVLRLPGVSDATATSVTAQIKQAGGTAQTWVASQGLVGADDKPLVDTLGSQLVAQMPADLITPEATTYVRIGELVGVALASPQAEGDAGEANAATVLESLRTAKLLTGPATAPTRAPLVLVLAADPDLSEGVDLVHNGLVTGLATQAFGVVVATDAESDLAASLAKAKVTEKVAVLDGVDNGAGQLATTLALVRSLNTRGGSFGVSGADGMLPLL